MEPNGANSMKLRSSMYVLGAGVLGLTAIAHWTVTTVTSDSMRPYLSDGQKVLLRRLAETSPGLGSNHATPISRGDVVVLRLPAAPRLLVKRVVALEGDSIRIEEGLLFVNGNVLYEPYARHSSAVLRISDRWPAARGSHPLVVPQGRAFVLGDNRSESSDSRVWGTVPLSSIVAKVVVRLSL